MVNFYVVSQYSGTLPGAGASRKIAEGPLYELADIHALAGVAHSLRFWTRGSEQEARDLDVDTEDVAQWLLELTPQNYRDSEWCTDGRAWAACDAYLLQRNEWIAAVHKHMPVDYFLKFAIARSGALVLMVSCHTSR